MKQWLMLAAVQVMLQLYPMSELILFNQTKSVDKEKKLLLHDAINQEDFGLVINLLQTGFDPNELDESLNCPLHIAVGKRQIATVELLLQYGAYVNQRNNRLCTPLHLAIMACSEFRSMEELCFILVDVLLRAGADVRCVDDADETPLEKAINGRMCTVVKKLLGAGADVSRACKTGITPLHRAAANGLVKIMMLLLGNTGFVNQRNCWQRTPLHDAVCCLRRRKSAMILSLLLDKGAMIDAVDEKGETPLFKAVDAQDYNDVQILLIRGANQWIAKEGNITPLHHAAYKSFDQIVSLLLMYKAPVNVQNDWLRTPLHDAAHDPNKDILCMLIKKGASIMIKDHIGRTPLDLVPANLDKIMHIYFTKMQLQTLALAMLDRTGQDSPAHNLTIYDLKKIYKYVTI